MFHKKDARLIQFSFFFLYLRLTNNVTRMVYSKSFSEETRPTGSVVVYIGLYYIFIAILMLFLVIFEIDKSADFLRGDKSFRTLKWAKSRQKQNELRNVTVSCTSLLDVIKGKKRTFCK